MERTLYLDTSTKYLVVGLADEHDFIVKHQIEAWQEQSEKTIPLIDEVLKKENLNPNDLSRIVITIGPGSYTGVRIGLTVGKVMAYAIGCPLCALSTLQVIAGPRGKRIALLDARSNRAYVGVYDQGVAVQQNCILTAEELNELILKYPEFVIHSEGNVLGHTATPIDYLSAMRELAKTAKNVENVHQLKPQYLKG